MKRKEGSEWGWEEIKPFSLTNSDTNSLIKISNWVHSSKEDVFQAYKDSLTVGYKILAEITKS